MSARCLRQYLCAPRRPGCHARRGTGFTLLELLFAICVIGLLCAIAYPTYSGIVASQKTKTCVRDLVKISMEIERYRTMHFELPMSLEQIDMQLQDPWGNDYRYLNFKAPIPGIQEQIRKDHNLHPLNSEFDLYSVGPDGRSRSPLTARESRDDIVWGRDGGFVGVAEDF